MDPLCNSWKYDTFKGAPCPGGWLLKSTDNGGKSLTDQSRSARLVYDGVRKNVFLYLDCASGSNGCVNGEAQVLQVWACGGWG